MLRLRSLLEIGAPALLMIWASMLFYSSIFGETGYRALAALESERAERERELDLLQARRAQLEQRAGLLNPRALDGDMIDEKIRQNLGFSREGDLIIPFDEIDRLLDGRETAAQ